MTKLCCFNHDNINKSQGRVTFYVHPVVRHSSSIHVYDVSFATQFYFNDEIFIRSNFSCFMYNLSLWSDDRHNHVIFAKK